MFESATGTSNLRKHLYTSHLEQWVSSCQQLNLKITAKAALPVVQEFLKMPATPSLEPQQEYSKEAFINALVEFIVGDDQVSIEIKTNIILIYLCSQSMSLNHLTCTKYSFFLQKSSGNLIFLVVHLYACKLVTLSKLICSSWKMT